MTTHFSPTRIFACAGVHEDLEALTAFTEFVRQESGDLILIAGNILLKPYGKGDLADYETARGTGHPNPPQMLLDAAHRKAEKVLPQVRKILEDAGMPYRVVHGTYDPLLERYFDSRDLHKKMFDIRGGARISGYGGGETFAPHIEPLTWPREKIGLYGFVGGFHRDEMFAHFTDASKRAAIWLTHVAPSGICDGDDHGGSERLLAAINRARPDLVVCGTPYNGSSSRRQAWGPSFHAETQWDSHEGKRWRRCVVNAGNLGRYDLFTRMLDALDAGVGKYGSFVRLTVDAEGSQLALQTFWCSTPSSGIGKVRASGDEVNLRDLMPGTRNPMHIGYNM